MQDTDLFLELAGIAGVFVGFGALIAVRSGGGTELPEVAPMRMVSMAMLTIVAALAPVTLARYDLTDHQVWALGSAGDPHRLARLHRRQRPDARVPGGLGDGHREIGVTLSDIVGLGVLRASRHARGRVAPVIVLLGVAPDLEAALYFTVRRAAPAGDRVDPLMLVFAQRRPASA